MGVNPDPNVLFSREKLLSLVAIARQNFLQRDRGQAIPAYFPDDDKDAERTMSDSVPSGDASHGTTLGPSQSLKRKVAIGTDTLDLDFSLGEPNHALDTARISVARAYGGSSGDSNPMTSPPADRFNKLSFQPAGPWPSIDVYTSSDNAIQTCNDEPDVPVEQHERGRNDMINGAVGMVEVPLTDADYQDNTLKWCPTLGEAVEAMPRKVFRKQFLIDTYFPESRNNESWSTLPDDFCITLGGVGSAIREVGEIAGQVTDEHVMFALARRGGICDDDIVYPENIEPLIGSNDEGFDEDFWSEIWKEFNDGSGSESNLAVQQ